MNIATFEYCYFDSRVFKRKCDVEREDKLDNYKTEIEEKIKMDFEEMKCS